MRQIKFRGKAYSGLVIEGVDYSDQWVTGYLVEGEGGFFILKKVDGKMHYIGVKSYTIGQYTGQKDDFGKEIYEGDIVEDRTQDKILVKFYVHDDQQGYVLDLDSSLKVIGNKWDNPEINYYEHIDGYNPKL